MTTKQRRWKYQLIASTTHYYLYTRTRLPAPTVSQTGFLKSLPNPIRPCYRYSEQLFQRTKSTNWLETSKRNSTSKSEISLTPALSKIAEDFVVTDYIKPAMIKSVDPNQFGTIPSSSTVIALINMVHKWLGGTHETGAKIRVLLCDFRKSFDLIRPFTAYNKT